MDRMNVYASIFEIPIDIMILCYEIFELTEIRARIKNVDGLIFEVRSKETNHNIPHVHVAYAEYNISIAINDSRVLAGNLPKNKEKIAVNWVTNNRQRLIGEWQNLTLKQVLPMTMPGIGLKESR